MATIYDVFRASSQYDGNLDAHRKVIETLKKHGHTLKESSAWCSETVMAILYDAGAIGLYLDNTDIYYMCQQGFKEEKTKMLRSAPSAQAVYNALSSIILKISALGLIVMPNGGDTFVRKFITAHPRVIPTINQEGVFFKELNEKNKSSDTQYYKDYCKWVQKHISGKVRIIEYTSSKTEQAKIKAYCLSHGWDVYFSKHKELRGD